MRKKTSPLKILLVDPDLQNGIETKKLLSPLGIIYPAQFGSMAVKIFKEERPHLIVTELCHPLLNSENMLKQIREQVKPSFSYYVIALVSKNTPMHEQWQEIDPNLLMAFKRPLLIGKVLDTIWELGKEIREYRKPDTKSI